jgi:hypothetical protein
MSIDARIERMAAEARLEIALMYRRAQEEMNRRFAFINRSRGQRARFDRQRIQRSGTV